MYCYDKGKVTLVETCDTSGTTHNSENLLKLAREIIARAELKYNR